MLNLELKKKYLKMIDEKYLRVAINIRKTYLKLVANLDVYKKIADSISTKLMETVKDIEDIEKDYVDKKINDEQSLQKALNILNDVEKEGKRLEDVIDPINIEIEKLAKEEQELYRQIVEHHSNLTQDEIVSIVRDRLIKEGLS
jgi:predicted ribosome quality control (RQC) complex YloA/Tae2 family protein